MTIISAVTTWATNQILTASALDAEFTNVYNLFNNLDSASSTWTNVKGATINATTILKGKGTATNDSAATGYIGEYLSGSQTVATNFPATTVWGDGTSISLTAGDWDVSASLTSTANGSTMTRSQLGISSNTGNSSTGLVQGDNLAETALPVNAVRAGWASISGYRVSLASTTTYYLKVEAEFSAGTPQYVCRLSARRVR